MATRTLPNNFPFIHPNEGFTGEFMKASLMRRLAQAQNYLWANLRRVYAGHGYEGNGNLVNNRKYTNDSLNLAGYSMAFEALPDGEYGVPICTFYVPRNWCASGTLRLRTTYNLTPGAGSAKGNIYFVLYKLDDTGTGLYTAIDAAKPGENDGIGYLRIPQDQDYQCRVYISFYPAINDAENNATLRVTRVGARYYEAGVDDLHGLTNSQILPWENRYDLPANAAAASAFWVRLIHNTIWHWANRNPELCQAYLGDPWSGPSGTTWKEVGKYTPLVSRCVSAVAGQLQVYVKGGSTGCDVRLKQNGTVIQTWSNLNVGDTTLTVTPFAPPNQLGGEVEYTIEARNPTATSWGTVVWGVSLWEQAITLLGATGMAAPSNFAPLDEADCDGDDALLRGNFNKLFQNDRWLMANRPRMLVGDYRHKVLKRLAVDSGAGVRPVDARIDWTHGPDDYVNSPDFYRNMTICATQALVDVDAIGNYQYGFGASTGYNTAPFTWPYSLTFERHGGRLGRYVLPIPSGMKTHITVLQSNYVLNIRGRRARPYVMINDVNGVGPSAEEAPHVNKGYFNINYNGSVRLPQVRAVQPEGDFILKWLQSKRDTHNLSSGNAVVSIGARLPPQPLLGSAQPGTRPDGILFEMEMASIYLADEPLTADLLATL